MLSLRIFEHQSLEAGRIYEFGKSGQLIKKALEQRYISELWKLYDKQKLPFFRPTRLGVRLCEWVGVIRVLDLNIEILPKADRQTGDESETEKNQWQKILIEMLRVCKHLDTPAMQDTSLSLKSNSILDLYIQRFIQETGQLIRAGLIKKYKNQEVNSTALKGRLLMHRQLSKNLVHKERFYVEQSVYDHDHLLHRILFKALKALPLLCSNDHLVSQCHSLLLAFPQVRDIKVDSGTFDKLIFDRKSLPYQKAVQIAKLLLLNLRPDVVSGAVSSIAILFDMNLLWEEYVYQMLMRANPGHLKIHSQKSTMFWKNNGTSRHLKPDIVIEFPGMDGSPSYIVLDTKWKNLFGDAGNIAMDDLRQMFAYHHYFEAFRCYLLYPGRSGIQQGVFLPDSCFGGSKLGEKFCGVLFADACRREEGALTLDKQIGQLILENLGLSSGENIAF